MQCNQCGHENPFGNFFCGHCGSPLLQRPPAPARDTPVEEPAEPIEPQPVEERITGPSFLGLSEEPPGQNRLEYLYEDEPQHHYGRLILALLLLAGFGAFIGYQWKQLPNWYTALNHSLSRPSAQASTERASSDVPPAPTAPRTAPAPESTAPATAEPAASSADNTAHQPSTAPATAAQASTPSPVPQSDADPHSSATEAREDVAHAEPPPDETSALFTRGLAYLNGTGVPRSCQQALVFLNSAAQKGNAKANSQLGGLYATGHCVPLDRAKAYQYFTRARNAEHGRNVYVEHNREMLWSQMSDAEKARARAAE